MFLNKNIKYFLKLRGIKQASFAEHIDVSRGAAISYIQGNSMPNPEVLLKMADYFGVTVDALLKVDMSADGVPSDTTQDNFLKKLDELDEKIRYLEEINSLKDKLLHEYEEKYINKHT